MSSSAFPSALATDSSAKAPRSGLLKDEIALHDIHHPTILKAWELWNAVRGERHFPSRRDLSPRRLHGLLRNSVLIQVIDGGAEFVFRVIGDAIVFAQGASHQGMTMGELDSVLPGSGTLLLDVYRAVVAARAPHAFRGIHTRPSDGRVLFRESLILPLGASDEAVDHILAVLVYSPLPAVSG
jgi:hypothetical protein